MHPLHNNMNNIHGYGEDSNSGCYFHPKEVVVGVCALCLKEKLLVLAAKQGHTYHHHHHYHSSSSAKTSHHRNSSSNKINVSDNKKPPINLSKIFALGSLLNRFEFGHYKSDVPDDHDACSSSQEDSFISMKFEDSGVASWEKANTVSNKVSLEHCSMYWNNQNMNTKESVVHNEKSVIEHAKVPRGSSSLRWQKRIGHLLQLVKWKRSNKRNVPHVDHGVKVRKGWIRSLTKRAPNNRATGTV
ncbi:uncharacterized protein LOC123206094 [Mangifera indica]|uniref:uncharacterized protein LOC123206094 n=1 Tax=Mangifera indica TaxID=29780 RepID=UPI001CFAD82A|nr:uncharacterized protein LOC123206094 [Mangifera indica]